MEDSYKGVIKHISMDFQPYFQEWEDIFKECVNSIGNEDIIFTDWAGIGDANCHSRLIIEHYYKNTSNRICWLTPKIVSTLYKDDNRINVIGSFYNPYRRLIYDSSIDDVINFTDSLFNKYLPGRKFISISNNICRYYKNHSISGSYSDFFFSANNIDRDYSIYPTLIHNSYKEIEGHCIFLEYSSCSHSNFDNDSLNNIINLILKTGSQIMISGVKDNNDFSYSDNIIDIRNMNMYDTFSYAKSCFLIIGRSSGNQSLAVFLRDIPLIEIEVPLHASYKTCSLHPNVTNLTYQQFIEDGGNLIRQYI